MNQMPEISMPGAQVDDEACLWDIDGVALVGSGLVSPLTHRVGHLAPMRDQAQGHAMSVAG